MPTSSTFPFLTGRGGGLRCGAPQISCLSLQYFGRFDPLVKECSECLTPQSINYFCAEKVSANDHSARELHADENCGSDEPLQLACIVVLISTRSCQTCQMCCNLKSSNSCIARLDARQLRTPHADWTPALPCCICVSVPSG